MQGVETCYEMSGNVIDKHGKEIKPEGDTSWWDDD